VIFPAFVEPFVTRGAAPSPTLIHALAVATAIFEFATGIALLIRRFRPAAVIFAIAMHAFILLILGPAGRHFNIVIWPWNLAMIAFLLILFFRREIIWRPSPPFQKVVLFLFGILPALTFFHLWDDYLSSALYTGNVDTGVIYLTDDAFEQLPEKIQDHVDDEGPNRAALNINDWSFAELNVPAYPAIRIFKNVATHVCSYVSNGTGIELVIHTKFDLTGGNRSYSYRCSDLRPVR